MDRAIVLGAAVALAAAGCGKSHPPKPTVSPAARAAADNLCGRAGLRLKGLAVSQRRAHAKPGSALGRRVIADTGSTLERLSGQLRAVPGSPSDRAALLGIAQAIGAQGQRIRALADALTRRNQAAIAAIKQEVDQDTALVRSRAAAAGLHACGAG
jgi:hypothetical protein